MNRFGRCLVVLIAIGVSLAPAGAQFGKNKVTYETFDWKVYESPHFDIHYYPEVEPFLDDVVSYAESAYVKLSKSFDHELRWRVPMIIYKTQAEFQQTNIQLAEIPEAQGEPDLREVVAHRHPRDTRGDHEQHADHAHAATGGDERRQEARVLAGRDLSHVDSSCVSRRPRASRWRKRSMATAATAACRL